MSLSLVYKIIAFLSVIIIFIFYPKEDIKLANNQVDNCVNCHKDYGSLDEFHPVEIFGCAKCHGGDISAKDKETAHKNIIKNPSYLQHAQIFCYSCHKDVINRISISPMQTQKGIKDVLHYQWVKLANSNDLNKSQLANLANDHYAKACAGCHINQNTEVFLNKDMQKGGGCSNCHLREKSHKNHSKYSTKIPTQTCLKCHNRSNRIGLSYIGKFESEGYGTPYKEGKLTHKLDEGRFYYELPADIHHQKAQLDCIDCHTHKGVMGDGIRHSHMEMAVDISCEDCHKATFVKPDKMSEKLSYLNANIPLGENLAITKRKNTLLYNLQKNGENIRFYRKKDGKAIDFKMMSENPYHTDKIHERLDCSACHSSWIASCYGCHEVYFKNAKQFDWVKSKMTEGSWQEFRSFLRYESPLLGIAYNNKIMPFSPGCQVIGSVFEDEKVKQFHSMAMAGWSPHSTNKSRTCIDCHINPTSLGLGRGNLDIKNNDILFTPFYDSNKSGQVFSYPIDAFVSKEGKQFQSVSRENARSFNTDELHNIINAYKCIICHRSWEDKIYRDFASSKEKFYKKKTPCEL